MRKLKTNLLILFVLLINLSVSANNSSDALDYFQKVSDNINTLTKPSLEYSKSVFVEQDSVRIIKLQQALVIKVEKALDQNKMIGSYNSDGSLYRAANNYLESILESHTLIMAIQKIQAQRSYDKMLKFVGDFEKVNQNISNSFQKFEEAQLDFGKKHGFDVVKSKSEDADNIESAQGLSKYYNVFFLIKFRCQINESNFIESFNNSDISGMKGKLNDFKKAVSDGINESKSISGFKGDNSLKNDLVRSLNFYKKEIDFLQSLYDYRVLQYDFTTADKKFRSIKKPTNDDINAYNVEVEKYNKASKEVDVILSKTNEDRLADSEKWNATVSIFFKKNY